MSFFLIGKGPDGSLTLLSERTFETRADAMAELSRITADESFSLWDHEVVVGDLQGTTPVLLVRPAHATAPAPEPSSEVTATPQPDESEADLISTDEAVSEPASAPETERAPELSTGSEEEQTEDLKEALRRTTVSLEAEGIVPPESVGPAETPVVTEAGVEEGESTAAADVDQGEGQGEGQEAPDAFPEAPDAVVVEADVPAWPWATKEEPKPFDLDALEEPGEDEGSLVRAPGDDETMSAARPVILGAYEEAPSADTSDVDALLADLESPEVPDTSSVREEPSSVVPIPVPPPLPSEESSSAGAASEVADPSAPDLARPQDVAQSMSALGSPELGAPESTGPGSDFVDLPPVSSDPIDNMTCEDCVYTETCPNKGQRDPASCGSFQWK